MTIEEARKVLGLGPDDDPETHLAEFRMARERIAEMVRTAPNDTIALRYQDGLLEFDKALAAIREDGDRRRKEKVAPLVALVPHAVTGETPEPAGPSGTGESSAPARADEAVKAPQPDASRRPRPTPAGAAVEEEVVVAGSGSKRRWIGYLLLFALVGSVGGAWLFFYIQEEQRVRTREQLVTLEGLGAKLVEARRWDAAEETYRKMDELDPGSETAQLGRRSIEVGMREEQEQFVGYWAGEAIAAFESGRLEDAREAAAKVIERYPDESEVVELLGKIEEAQVVKLRDEWVARTREAVAARDWEEAWESRGGLAADLPDDSMLEVLQQEIEAGIAKEKADLARAGQLAAAARQRDAGKFDRQALEWLREAIALAPDDAEIRALYDRMASYTRTVRVPEDAATLEEALAGLRAKDRVVLGKGTWAGAVSIDTAIQLEGAGTGETTIECPAATGPAVTFLAGADGASVSGIRFRQSGFDPGEARFSTVLVRGAAVDFGDCAFVDGSGHGLELREGAVVTAERCRFESNGWDGVSVRDDNSRLVAGECESKGNFGHGFDIWDGGGAKIRQSRASGNSRNGILVDAATEGLELSGNELVANREYGLVLATGASGKVTGNLCRENLLGGMVVRFAAISVRVEDNRLERNGGPGMILEQGLREEIYRNNRASGNRSRAVLSGVSFGGEAD